MADPIVNTFSLGWMQRIMRAVQYVEMNLMGATSGRTRRQVIGGDGGTGCDTQNAIWDILILGDDLGGTFFLPVTVDGTTENITFAPDDDAASFKTKLVTHSKIATGDLTVTGEFPTSTMRVEFIDTLAGTDILNPRADWTSLTGSVGRGVHTQLSQKGHS